MGNRAVTQSTADRLGMCRARPRTCPAATVEPSARARSGDTRSAKHAFLKHTSKKKQVRGSKRHHLHVHTAENNTYLHAATVEPSAKARPGDTRSASNAFQQPECTDKQVGM